MNDCSFCDIKNNIDSARQFIYQDELVTIIDSLHSDSRMHLLIIPNKHIHSCKSISIVDMYLIYHMRDISKQVVSKLLKTKDPAKLIIGFNRPPFITCPHLHLHVIVKPVDIFARIKYTDYTPWFISIDRFIKKINAKAFT